MPDDGKVLSNTEIVTLAVYLLGGETTAIDTEDVAVKANALAPGRFTWRKYRDQINLELVRVRLSEAKNADKHGLLLGSGARGWLLSPKGLAFAQSHVAQLEGASLSRETLGTKERRWRHRERARMLDSEAYAKYHADRVKEITAKEAESFFHIDDYIIGKARERVVARLLNAFSNDPELGPVVTTLRARLPER